MIPNIFIKRIKPSINKMKAADLKALGFKTKAIAKTFAKLSDVTAKNYKTEFDFMEALKRKVDNFKKLGLEFNNAFKKHDVSSQKVKANRVAKLEKKNQELLQKIDKIIEIKKKKTIIKPYDIDNGFYKFYVEPTEPLLREVSEHYLLVKNYKKGNNKDYIPIEKTEHTRKKTFTYEFNGGVSKMLGIYLMNIYKQQKFTFKLTVEFSFLLIDVNYTYFHSYVKNKFISVDFALFLPSTNTRPKGFENPIVVDNKKDIDDIIKKLTSADLIEQYMLQRKDSRWKFYRFLDVKFHVYEMNTPIGKANELPIHFKEGSNEKALIKYENYDDYLCFWRCLSYHQTKPEDPRNINKKMKQIFNDYYNKKIDDTYKGVEYVAYNKEYTDEALDNEEYDKKNDELDLIEKHFNININVYTHDEPELLQIDRRSITNYDDTLNLMRYNNHFMYIKD